MKDWLQLQALAACFYSNSCQRLPNLRFRGNRPLMTETTTQSDPQEALPHNRGQIWLRFGVFLPFFVILIDQITKFLIIRFFEKPLNICEIDPTPAVKFDLSPIMDFSLVCNQGISWGLLQGDSPLKRWLLTVFAFGMSGLLFWVLGQTRDRLSQWGLGLVIGGALGNAIDRFFFGAVTDFIDFSDIGFNYAFNIADSAITVGVVMLFAGAFLTRDETKTAK